MRRCTISGAWWLLVSRLCNYQNMGEKVKFINRLWLLIISILPLISMHIRVQFTIIRAELKMRHKSILVTDYLTKMGIKTVPYLPYSPDLAPCDFWLRKNLEAVIKRQLRRWKRLWRKSWTRSYNRTSMGPSRSF